MSTLNSASFSRHPRALKPGSVIGITAPAGHIPADRVSTAAAILKNWGFRVKQGRTIGTGKHYFSGTDEARAADLQAFLNDDGIDAILMARGGYGMSRIIDRLDFTAFARRPKWICGFSDITVLHSHLQRHFGIPTLHSPMCGAIRPETAESGHVLSLRNALTGETLRYDLAPHPFNRHGRAEAVLTGGNLAILAHLSGTTSAADMTGKILFIEDIGEHLYQIDRMLVNLERTGQLASLAGVVIGEFTDTEDTERPFGQTLDEILRDRFRPYDYPVMFGFPAGHGEINHTLALGMAHVLDVSAEGGSLRTLPFAV